MTRTPTATATVTLTSQALPWFDGGETGGAGWTMDQPWALMPAGDWDPVHSGSYAWSDSPGALYSTGNYPPAGGLNTALFTPWLDVQSVAGQQLELTHWVRHDLAWLSDYLQVHYRFDSGPWHILATTYGSSSEAWVQRSYTIPVLMGASRLRVRFNLRTGGSVAGDGVHLDDVQIQGAPPTLTSTPTATATGTRTPTATRTPTPTATSTPEPAGLSVRSSRLFTPEGYEPRVVGEVENTKGGTAYDTRVAVVFRFPSGAVAGTSSAYTTHRAIPPGSVSPFLITVQPGADWSTYEFSIAHQTTSYYTYTRALSVTNVSSYTVTTWGTPYRHIAGEVVNGTGVSWEGVKAVATIYDAAGNVLYATYDYVIPSSTLSPGGTGVFEISFPDDWVAAMTRFDVVAEGRHEQ